MFNFAEVVTNILLEQGPEPVVGNTSQLLQNIYNSQDSTFKELKNIFDSKFGFTTNLNDLYTELNNTVPGGKYNIAAKYVNDTYIPYIDAFSLAVKQMTSDPKAEQKPTMGAILQNILNEPNTYNPIFSEVASNLQKLPLGSRPIDYVPTHPNVNRAANTLRNESEKLSQTAVESLYNDTIFDGVTKIIAKRTNVFDRIGKIKGVRRPFSSSLIKPILVKYKNYVSLGAPGRDVNWEKVLGPLYGNWQKKVSGDFNEIVDGVTADNLITIAVLAGEYYLSLLRGVIVANENVFTASIKNVLNEYSIDPERVLGSHNPLSSQQQTSSSKPKRQRDYKAEYARRKELKTQRANQADSKQQNVTPEGATPLSQAEYDDIARGLGDGEQADHSSFITNGTSRYLGKAVYNIGTISKDPSREAKALFNAIKSIAYHVQKGPGMGDRIKGLNQALQGVWGMSGHRLYN